MRSLILRTLLHALVCAGFYAGIVLLHRAEPPAAVGVPIEWRFQAPGAASTQAVTVPDRWTGARQALAAGRYQGRFRLAEPPAETWAVYLHSLGSSASLRLNGVAIGDSGRLTATLQRQRFQPLLLRIAPSLLQPGDNVIAIEVQADPPGGGFLGAVQIGPDAQLQPAYQQRRLLKRDGVLALVVAAFVLGGVSLMLWLGRRQARIYLWHALTCFAGGCYYPCFLIGRPLLPAPWWDALPYLLFAWFVIAAAMLGMYYVGDRRPRMARGLLACGALAPLLLAVAAMSVNPTNFHQFVLPAFQLAVLALGTWTMSVLYLRELLPKADATSFWMLQAALLLAATATHDTLLLAGWIAPWDGLYFPFAGPLPLAAFTWVLLQRFLAALQEAETLNRELADRVAQREAEIERSYKALRQAEQDRAVADERERLFADMHDGLGGTLVAALARLDNEGAADSPAARAVQDALDDLRLILHSLDPGELSLRAALALLRERLEPACADVGVTLEFDLRGLTDDRSWNPARLLQLLRIVQEASSNVLRHARASRLRIAAALVADGAATASRLRLTIEDDGLGFDATTAARPGHHGLANLRRRALRLGGDIDWSALQPGTRVSLRLPLEPAAPG